MLLANSKYSTKITLFHVYERFNHVKKAVLQNESHLEKNILKLFFSSKNIFNVIRIRIRSLSAKM